MLGCVYQASLGPSFWGLGRQGPKAPESANNGLSGSFCRLGALLLRTCAVPVMPQSASEYVGLGSFQALDPSCRGSTRA